MIRHLTAGFMALFLALALTAPLAGCGKKGDLEAPPGKTIKHPQQYPPSNSGSPAGP